MLDNSPMLLYNNEAVRNAAIAQPVERILGKDEVASSNLASSSKKSVIPYGMADFLSLLVVLIDAPVQIWGATRPPPVAEKGRGASGSGRRDASLLRQAQHLPGTATGERHNNRDQKVSVFFFLSAPDLKILNATGE